MLILLVSPTVNKLFIVTIIDSLLIMIEISFKKIAKR